MGSLPIVSPRSFSQVNETKPHAHLDPYKGVLISVHFKTVNNTPDAHTLEWNIAD